MNDKNSIPLEMETIGFKGINKKNTHMKPTIQCLSNQGDFAQ